MPTGAPSIVVGTAHPTFSGQSPRSEITTLREHPRKRLRPSRRWLSICGNLRRGNARARAVEVALSAALGSSRRFSQSARAGGLAGGPGKQALPQNTFGPDTTRINLVARWGEGNVPSINRPGFAEMVDAGTLIGSVERPHDATATQSVGTCVPTRSVGTRPLSPPGGCGRSWRRCEACRE